MPPFAFVASETKGAQEARACLIKRYGACSLEKASTVIALGGDGLMLQTIHQVLATGQRIYGMHLGSIGFLMNDYALEGLEERVAKAHPTSIHPLKMISKKENGECVSHLAFNEVSLLRQHHQAAKLEITVDGKVRLPELICDGILVATPAGSTAYNLSAQGPILPLEAPLLALTPISAFRPRRWRGAILPHEAEIEITVLEPQKRPVLGVADFHEVRHIVHLHVFRKYDLTVTLLFDEGHTLAERILAEQFAEAFREGENLPA